MVQPSIVTCSGYRNFGSINVIRKGADFEELAVIDGLPNVTGIWPIRALFEDESVFLFDERCTFERQILL